MIAEAAEKGCRPLDRNNQLPKLILGVKVTDGIVVITSLAQPAGLFVTKMRRWLV
jgi:hypothetical protein